MRVVLDTDIVVAAIRSRKGASRQLLAWAIEGKVEALTSVALALEYEAIALLPKHLDAGGLTRTEVSMLLDALVAASDPVIVCYKYRPQLRDPNDEMVLETAINGLADAIITFNLADYRSFGRILPQDFGIVVLQPSEAVMRFRGQTESFRGRD